MTWVYLIGVVCCIIAAIGYAVQGDSVGAAAYIALGLGLGTYAELHA